MKSKQLGLFPKKKFSAKFYLGGHWAYFKYLMRHKWYVFIACLMYRVPLWRAIVHDWHKFLPCEWFPYVHAFYNADGSKKKFEGTTAEYDRAWNHHQKMGKHHWQYWLLTFDRGDTVMLDIPETYVREMLADWWGAGRAITGQWGADLWYDKNAQNIKVHPKTRDLLEVLLKGGRIHINRKYVKTRYDKLW